MPYATTDAASAAVTADKTQLTADQNAQHADQLSQLDAQNQQSRDQASLTDAKAGGSASLVSTYTNAVNQDQYTLDFLQKKLSEDAWAITRGPEQADDRPGVPDSPAKRRAGHSL